MKKITAVLLSVLIILAYFDGCHREQEQPSVGLCMRQSENGITGESVAYLEEALSAAGFRVEVLNAKNDQSKQLEQIRQLTEEDCDVVIIEPVMTGAAQEIVQILEDSKTCGIFIHREPEQSLLEGSEDLCYVGPDAVEPGRLQPYILEQLADHGDINGDGQISYVYLGGPEEDLDTQLRLAGCREKAGIVGKNLTSLEIRYGQWDRESGMTLLKQLLAKYGKDIEVVFCANDDIAIGALEAVKDGGRTVGRDIYLLGIDGQQHGQVLIRSGELTGTVALDLRAMADTVASLALDLLAGKPVEDRYVTSYILLTQDNIEEYMQ